MELWDRDPVTANGPSTVWSLLRDYCAHQNGPFGAQEAVSWFRRHAPEKANERTIRTHIRGACWNVDDRSQFANKEPFLTKLDRGVFRRATDDELAAWRAQASDAKQAVSAGVSIRGSAEARPLSTPDQPGEHLTPPAEWHTEANVQAALVATLVRDGWRIHSVANTATKEHGVDVVASKDQQTFGVEVKGFPSVRYADPARACEAKRTSPSTQAVHWFSQAILAAMRLRIRQPDWRSVIALPDFPRYRALHAETKGSLAAAEIELWWVSQAGDVERPDY